MGFFLTFLLTLFGCLLGDPVAFTEISKITTWWPESNIAKSMGVPTYANTTYNYFSFQSWTCLSGISAIPSVYAKPLSIFGSNMLGSTDDAIRQQLKLKYQSTGSKVILGVFGELEYPVRFGQNATACAQKLSNDVINYNFDGVEINYQDEYTFQMGTAQQWLIDFTKTLRQLLPNYKIIHTVDASYFRGSNYPNQGYIKINNVVGSMIDLYNIKYFGVANSTFTSYQDVFIQSAAPNTNISVKQLSQLGVNLNKIVVGKSAKAGVNGYVVPTVLNSWAAQAKSDIGWSVGYSMGNLADDDSNGNAIKMAMDFLRTGANPSLMNTTVSNTSSTQNTTTTTTNQTSSTTNSSNSTTTTNLTNTTQTSNSSSIVVSNSTNPYPVYMVYVNRLNSWWGNDFVAGLGVPGYAPTLPYNYYALSFWLSSGPADVALAWANAGVYFSWISTDTQQVQKMLRKAFNDAGKKILVSAFGSTQFPTTHGMDPIIVANNLAAFVLNNNLDGVDIDWQDNNAMEQGIGQDWLIKFQTQLRNLLPNHIISHAPQAPYFKQQYYKNGAYMTVHKAVGNLIDFYNVQFYNQGDTTYGNYTELFLKATGTFSGTSYFELMNRGIPAKKIVVGKPATQADVMNTGYVTPQNLGSYWAQFKAQKGVDCQLMIWQLVSDLKGTIGNTILSLAGVNLNATTNTTTTTTNTTTNTTNSTTNGTSTNNTNTNTTTTNNTTGSSSPTTNTTTTNTTTNASTTQTNSYMLSMFYCGFGPDYCGQSNTDDVNSKASIVILAFANILKNGSIQVDQTNFPTSLQNSWKASNKKVLLSVGGQNVDWTVAFTSNQTISNFISSVVSAVSTYNLDGVDLNIQTYSTPPKTVANMIISLKTQLNNKLLTVTPEDVAVYEGVAVPSADLGGQAWNYFVPIIILADKYIDYYQVQAYNNWYGSLPGGSSAYLQEVYLNWRNLPATIQYTTTIPNFNGVDGNKLFMGVLASTSAGGSSYYATPQTINQFQSWLKTNNYPLKGFMMWDSNWDKLNSFLISNAIINPSS